MQRRLIILSVLAAVSLAGNAHAQAANGTISSSTETAAVTDAQIDVGSVNSNGDTHFSGSYATVPGMGTMLISPTAPCSDAYSGQGVGVGFGFGISGSHVNQQCNLLETSRAAYNEGQRETAVNMLCKIYDDRFARAVEGDPCPAAYNQPGDPAVIKDAKQVAMVPAAPGSAASYEVPSPVLAQPTASPETPTHPIPAWCNMQPSSNDPADKASYNYYCRPQ